MAVMIGGPKAWKTRQTGDIGVSYQWVNDEPAMILFPARHALPGHGAYVVCLSAAFKYADSKTGGPTPYLIEAAKHAADVMGMFPDQFTLRRIADVIVDGLPDLVDMPPEPVGFNEAEHRAIAGEMTIRVDGQTIHEAEVTAPTEAELMGAHA
jgi:hypothetical protein